MTVSGAGGLSILGACIAFGSSTGVVVGQSLVEAVDFDLGPTDRFAVHGCVKVEFWVVVLLPAEPFDFGCRCWCVW